VVHWYIGYKLAQEEQRTDDFRLQAISILQHAQPLGETQGKVHLSSETLNSGVWKQATRLLVASSTPGGHSAILTLESTHPDLLREFARLLLYIPGLFGDPRLYMRGFNAWIADYRAKTVSHGSLLTRGPSKQDIAGFWAKGDKNSKLWGYPKHKIIALSESLIAKCDDPSLWLEAVVVGSRKLFATYRQQGSDFFFHRSSYSYLGATFSGQRSRWMACGYPFLPRVKYCLSVLGTLSPTERHV
jgi:hypothetical protein